MVPAARWVLPVVLALAQTTLAQAQYSIKSVKADPPQEVHESVRKLCGNDSVQLLDGKGGVVCQLWFAKSIPADATAEQVKNGLTYRELKETAVMGVVKFDQAGTDYRKQKIKAGVYTLRLGFQPMDGDHMGTSPFPEFCLLAAAGKDTKPGTMEPKSLVEMSTSTMGTSHPGVLMLFPNNKPSPTPQLAKKENNHWVLNTQLGITVGGQPTQGVIGIALTLVGHAE